MNPTNAIAPGKLILSGEHAVVRGAPAIAMAVDKFMTAHIVPADEIPFKRLSFIKSSLDMRYQAFRKKSLKINQVIDQPEALIAYCAAQVEDKLTSGFALSNQANLPMGCGMGSSAALIISLHKVFQGAFGYELDNHELYTLALEAENLVHGISSGLDLQLSIHGGMHKFMNGALKPLKVTEFKAQLIHTGKAESTTGECVVQAGLYLSDAKVAEFATVTDKMEKALNADDGGMIWNCIKENHKLLVDIGVVPEPVRKLASDIEAAGGAAKICGAGSVKGDGAGMLWVYGLNKARAADICDNHGEHIQPFDDVMLCHQGATIC